MSFSRWEFIWQLEEPGLSAASTTLRTFFLSPSVSEPEADRNATSSLGAKDSSQLKSSLLVFKKKQRMQQQWLRLWSLFCLGSRASLKPFHQVLINEIQQVAIQDCLKTAGSPPVTGMHACNPSTWEASLTYMVNSRPAWDTDRVLSLNKIKYHKQKGRWLPWKVQPFVTDRKLDDWCPSSHFGR